jgi:hypothetical protein
MAASGQGAQPEFGQAIEAGGVLTNYHEAGAGAPVVLLHGELAARAAVSRRAAARLRV